MEMEWSIDPMRKYRSCDQERLPSLGRSDQLRRRVPEGLQSSPSEKLGIIVPTFDRVSVNAAGCKGGTGLQDVFGASEMAVSS